MASGKNKSAIEEMDQLLDHISSFEQCLNKSDDLSDPDIQQEYKLLKEYLGYRIQDMQKTARTELHQITHPGS